MNDSLFHVLHHQGEMERITEERDRYHRELKAARALIKDYRAKLVEQEIKIKRLKEWIACS